MLLNREISAPDLRSKIRQGVIQWGGHQKRKIYGRLRCVAGKKMKKENRVFFGSEKEALEIGYRPCGHCKKEAYKCWKDGII
ncbi:MAG: metal-binding protein [Microscillaceae bacterium]|nr:metal-binding protein [Microscillaceae bacterium]